MHRFTRTLDKLTKRRVCFNCGGNACPVKATGTLEFCNVEKPKSLRTEKTSSAVNLDVLSKDVKSLRTPDLYVFS